MIFEVIQNMYLKSNATYSNNISTRSLWVQNRAFFVSRKKGVKKRIEELVILGEIDTIFVLML